MKILQPTLIVLLCILFDVRYTQAQSIRGDSVPTIVTLNVPAPSLIGRDSTEIIVHLPDSYLRDSERNYPVIFYLHGWGSNAGEFQQLGGVIALTTLPDENAFVVVAVSGETSGYRNWADGKSLWEDHLIGTIVDETSRQYRVATHRDGRALYGVSMGGAAALRIAMSRPDMFACAAAHSAAVSPVAFDDQPEWQRTGYFEMKDFSDRYGNPFDHELWKAANPLYIALTADPVILRSVQYYFDVGIDDHLGFADDNAALSQVLAARSIPHTFALRSGGHGGSFVEANMNHAVTFLSKCVSSGHESTISE